MILLVGTLCLALSSVSADDFLFRERELSGDDVRQEAHKPAVKIRSSFFAPYRKDFQAVCTSLAEDKALDYFLQVLESDEQPQVPCPACKPFFRAFRSGCRSARRIDTTAKVQQIDPHPRQLPLLIGLSRHFQESPEELVAPLVQAMRTLSERLQTGVGGDKRLALYFDSWGTFLTLTLPHEEGDDEDTPTMKDEDAQLESFF